jgi:hypothetical protein
MLASQTAEAGKAAGGRVEASDGMSDEEAARGGVELDCVSKEEAVRTNLFGQVQKKNRKQMQKQQEKDAWTSLIECDKVKILQELEEQMTIL